MCRIVIGDGEKQEQTVCKHSLLRAAHGDEERGLFGLATACMLVQHASVCGSLAVDEVSG